MLLDENLLLDPAGGGYLGLGVRELSVGAASVAAVKEVVRDTDLPDCAELARRAVSLPSAQAVRELMWSRPGSGVGC